jgi:hypothetical protein
MNRKYIYTLIGTAIVSGFSGYFIYTRIKIARVNAKFSTIDEAEKVIGNIDVSDIPPEAREPIEPTLPPTTDQPAEFYDSKYMDDNSIDEYYNY